MKHLPFLLVLIACAAPARQGSTTPAEHLHAAVTARLHQDDFRQIEGRGPIGGVQSPFYATTMTTGEVLGILTPITEPYTRGVPWADDYGQYHVGLKRNPLLSCSHPLGLNGL